MVEPVSLPKVPILHGGVSGSTNFHHDKEKDKDKDKEICFSSGSLVNSAEFSNDGFYLSLSSP